MNVILKWKYKTPRGIQAWMTSDELPTHQAMLMAKDIEKTGRALDLYFLDDRGMKWSFKEFEKFTAKKEESPSSFEIIFDGSFDKETKEAGCGAVIYFSEGRKKKRIRVNKALSYLENNNEAEYAALWTGLQELKEIKIDDTDIVIKGDSKVVISQLSGEWAVYEPLLTRWMDRIEDTLKELRLQPIYELISRNDNKEAHRLAVQALRGTEIDSVIELDE
ncbi:reverse transcriptase-like protein [Guptibacillus algicola]|uniref:reverse transcriptase-like protein n=1 Tax=Guptibacillus algicola TaxID=225844 RepID=UPI001CD3CF7B|nr:reverse transcriptase-like protein [Alkalihalobacillus algicola]MCA0988196.1 reverse transcriptase-like protein [Alkalihalobacillus algicola]